MKEYQIHLLGGSIAGIVSDAVVHPIDTIRVRSQMVTGESISSSKMFTKVVKNEGFRALYKGFGIVALGTVPGHALYFAGYESCKKGLNSYFNIKDDKNILVHLTSGLVADVYGSLIWCPMDIIKQRLQYNRKNKIETKITEVAKNILSEEGKRGFFRGYWAGLATYGPYVSLYFAFYEQFKIHTKNILKKENNEHLPFYMYLMGAGMSACVSAAITCPLDVMKTRIQIKEKGLEYNGIFDAAGKIYKSEGLGAFFRGIKPRCLWISGGTAVTMVAYEGVKKLFEIT